MNCLSGWVFSNRTPAVFVDVVGVALSVEVLVCAAQGVVELEGLRAATSLGVDAANCSAYADGVVQRGGACELDCLPLLHH